MLEKGSERHTLVSFLLHRNTIHTLLMLLLMVSSLSAIHYREGSHSMIPSPEQREYSVAAWHTNIDDQHWYGTTKWAVLFHFNEILHSASDTVSFRPYKARIYFPVQTPNVHLELKPENQYAVVDTVLASGDATAVSGMVDITLTPAAGINVSRLTGHKFWLIIEMNTDVTGPYMAAQQTGGSHSYYWDTTSGTNAHFTPMAASGFTSEFLVGLLGNYGFTAFQHEMELLSYSLDGERIVSGTLRPSMQVKNNASVTIPNPMVYTTLENAFNLEVVKDTIYLPAMGPGETFTIDGHNTADYCDPITLHDLPCQYSYKAQLDSGYPSSQDIAFNNLYDANFFVYRRSDAISRCLVENFAETNAQTDYLTPLLEMEDDFEAHEDLTINYFPEMADSLFASEAIARFSTYEGFAYPTVILNGTHKMIGFQPTVATDSLPAYYNASHNEGTFISEGVNTTLPVVLVSNQIRYNVNFENQTAYVFPDYLSRCRFFAAVVQQIPGSAIYPPNIFRKFVCTNDSLVRNLAYNGSRAMIFEYSLSELNLLHPQSASLGDCTLITWIQNRDDNKVLYMNSYSLSGLQSIVSNDIPLPVPSLQVYPNPVCNGSMVQIRCAGTEKVLGAQLQIYNIKGQEVYHSSIANQLPRFEWNQQNMVGHHVGSGIYFARVQIRSASGGLQTFVKKLVLVP